MGGHVFRMAILQYAVFYWKTCLTGGPVPLEGMCYSRTHVVVVVMSHENVLGEDMCSRWACLTGLCRSCNHLSCYGFRQQVCCCFFPVNFFWL